MLLGLMGLLETVLDVAVSLFYHTNDGRETVLGKHEEDDGKRQEHPEQESQIGCKDSWQFTEIHKTSILEFFNSSILT